jgi:hypothetical protein
VKFGHLKPWLYHLLNSEPSSVLFLYRLKQLRNPVLSVVTVVFLPWTAWILVLNNKKMKVLIYFFSFYAFYYHFPIGAGKVRVV